MGNLTRREFIGKMALGVAGLGLGGCASLPWSKREFSFAMIADCQYKDAPKHGSRYYRTSLNKLRTCVNELNKLDLEFVIHLGDFIDTGWNSFDKLNPVYHALNTKQYQVLGNHDFAVTEDKKLLVPAKMGMTNRYYDFAVGNYRFITLDGNDLSLLAWPKGHERHKQSVEYYKKNKLSSPRWNGGIGSQQLIWLEQTLEKAQKNGETVVLFCHFPAISDKRSELSNSKEVVALLEKDSRVKAYINGHKHPF